mgnify:CR=1 FL=1
MALAFHLGWPGFIGSPRCGLFAIETLDAAQFGAHLPFALVSAGPDAVTVTPPDGPAETVPAGTASFTVSGTGTVTAAYVTQYKITFAQSGIGGDVAPNSRVSGSRLNTRMTLPRTV